MFYLQVIKQFGQIDILVDNSGVNPSPGKLLHVSLTIFIDR